MSHSPLRASGSKRYRDAWRAINLLIRSDGSWSGQERNTCYLNRGGGRFEDVSFLSGLDFPDDGRAWAALDLDNDGDLDLVLKSRTAPQVRILRNDVPWDAGSRRALRVELRGTKSNRDAIGARVNLWTNQRTLMRFVRSGSGYLSQSSRRLHFGLEKDERPAALEIYWPSGTRQVYKELPQSGLVIITEGIEAMAPLQVEALPRPARREAVKESAPGTWLVEPLPAPDFSVPSLEGPQFRLSEMRGRKVLLNFWASWCPPCRTELADFRAYAKQFSAAGLQVLAVSVDDPADRDAARKLAVELRLNFPVLLADHQMVAGYNVTFRHLFDRRRDLGLPTSFLIDEGGNIVKVYAGAVAASTVFSDLTGRNRSAIPFPGRRYTSPPGRNYVEIATALAENGLTQHALRLFETALASGHESHEILNNFAALLIREGEFERAEALLHRALALAPGQPEALANLGTVLLRRSNVQEAIRNFEAALAAQPDDPYAHNGLGSAYFTLGQMGLAEKHFGAAAGLAPDSPEYCYNLGSVLAASGRPHEAIVQFERSRELGNDSPALASSLGILYTETGQVKRGLAELHRAVELAPNLASGYFNLTMAYLQLGDLQQGRAWLTKVRELEPGNPNGSLLEAKILLQEGRSEDARAVLHKLLTTNPGHEEALELLKAIR